MRTADVVRTAFSSLNANRSRSALTILGIVVGIASMILVVAAGEGARELILGQLQGFGSRTLFIEPGREPTGPSSFVEIFTDSLKEQDVRALTMRGNVPGITDVAPVVIGSYAVSWRNESVRTSVIGATDIFAEILDVDPDQGVFFDDEEIKQRSPVAILGSEVRRKLFGETDAVGQIARIKNVNFRVVGTMPQRGNISFFDVDNLVLVPYTTAQQYLTGTDYLQTILVRVESEDIIPRVKEDIMGILRANHGITDPAKDDFHITTPADAAERVSMITGILTALLTAVAAISLVVGGIGIMNIMLVSVTERTREIGLRKAIGATRRDILSQFLLEAVLLTAAGGIGGIGLGPAMGYATSFVLSRALGTPWTFVFPLQAAAFGLVVAAAVGFVFGLYPAQRAARLDPVEALRYE